MTFTIDRSSDWSPTRQSVRNRARLASIIAVALIGMLIIVAVAIPHAHATRTRDTDNSFATATTIQDGDTVQDTVDEASDPSDYYKIMVTEGYGIQGSLSVDDYPNDDLDLGLYGPGQADDPLDYSYSTTDSETVQAVAQESGLHYIVVEAYDTGGSGAYTLTVNLVEPGEVDDDNDPENATWTECGDTFSDDLNAIFDAEDWYAINLTSDENGSQSLTVETAITPEDASLDVYSLDTDYNILASGPASSNLTFVAPETGKYYIAYLLNDGTADYTMTVSCGMMEKDNNEDPANATSVTAGQRIDDYIDSGFDIVDIYQIQIDASAHDQLISAHIQFESNIRASVTILDQDLNRLASENSYDYFSGYQHDFIVRGVANRTGTHYIEIEAQEGSSHYSLTVTVEEYISDGNNDATEATPLTEGQTVTDSVEYGLDPEDWYVMTLQPQTGSETQAKLLNATVTLDAEPVDYSVTFYISYAENGDPNNLTILDYRQSDRSHTQLTITHIVREAGDYYLLVDCGHGDTNYSLLATTSIVTVDTDNQFETATPVDLPYSGTDSLEKVVDTEDYYAVELGVVGTEADQLIATVTPIDDLQGRIAVYNDEEDFIDSTDISSSSTELRVIATYNATYYVKISIQLDSPASPASYQLDLDTTSITVDGNDHWRTADEIENGAEIDGTLNKTMDPSDYYKIYLYAGESIEVTLTIIPSNADFDLKAYDSNERQIASSAAGGSEDEYIEVAVNETLEGYIYLHVYSYRGSGAYRLMVTGDAGTGGAVELLSPANEHTVTIPGSVTLRWQLAEGSGTVTYLVYCASNEAAVATHDESALLAQVTATQYEFADPEDDVTYYWTVLPSDGLRIGDCINGPRAFTIALNDPPQIDTTDPTGSPSVAEGETLSLEVDASDPDAGDTGQLRYRWYVDGTRVDATGARFDYSPDFDTCYGDAAETSVEVKVRVSDPSAKFVEHTWAVIVTNVNRRPSAVILSPAAGDSFDSSNAIGFDASYSEDPDGEDLIYRWRSDIAGELANGTDPYSEVELPRGTHEVTLTVEDSQGLTNSTSVTITVRGGLLAVESIQFDVTEPRVGDEVTITVQLKNNGDGGASGAELVVLANGNETARRTLGLVPVGGTRDASISWTPEEAGDYTIVARASTPAQSESPGTKSASITVKEKQSGGDGESPGFELFALLAALVVAGTLIGYKRKR